MKEKQTPETSSPLSTSGAESEAEPTASNPEPPAEKSSIIRTILDYAVCIGIAIVVAFVINNTILLNAQVPTGSMESTINIGDRLFGFRLAYLFSDPQRGDIVIFPFPDDESKNYIKRIIGLPGETVTIRDGVVYISSEDTEEFILEEPYLKETPIGSFGPYEVPENSYFMMGDNRNNSGDSRFWVNTFVSRDKILAKAIFKYWKGFSLLF